MSDFDEDVVFTIVPPDWHDRCGHYHYRWRDCPKRGKPCKSTKCCAPDIEKN